MLTGYVSNEMYEAISDVTVEFKQNGHCVAETRSTATGAVRADIESGEYEVTLQKGGYARKQVNVTIGPEDPHQFRLLSERLLGYVWPQWCKAGDEANYYIHSPEETRISLWRYGYEKEQIRLIDWHDEHGPRTNLQQLPDGDFTRSGVRWNEVGYDYVSPDPVEAPSRTGLYYFHLETPSGAHFSFPWVIAPASPQSDIAVLAATNTWNAYNSFGGRSNYVNADKLPSTPTVHARTELDRFVKEYGAHAVEDREYRPLSFERPCLFNSISIDREITDPIRGKEGSHTAPAEWRFLGWLEREGHKHDLYAEMQLHQGDLKLDEYEVLITHTHPEYWSYDMFSQVKEWIRNDGGKLMYLGGNGLNAEVEVVDESQIRFLNNDKNVANDISSPEDIPNDKYESRFHRASGKSEGSLLGVVFTTSGIKGAAPYEVIDGSHWIFEGADLQEGDLFGDETLQERCSGGASGHETDKLSAYAPDDTTVIAKGTNPDNGGAEITYYETDSGGAVFSVGSITYPLGLLIDDEMTAITNNVIERFT